MKLFTHPIAIDRPRAARLLRDGAHLSAALLPFLLGLLARLVWRAVLILWIGVLWLVGAMLAGWDAGGRKR
jgi:hypothetical protein